MNYLINRATLTSDVIDEVTRVAARAYSQQGESLYDGIIITSGSIPQVEKLEDEAISSLVRRTSSICSQANGNPLSITFDIPDFPTTSQATATTTLNRFLTLAVCAEWFKARYATEYESYLKKAADTLDKAVAILKTRQAPTRRF